MLSRRQLQKPVRQEPVRETDDRLFGRYSLAMTGAASRKQKFGASPPKRCSREAECQCVAALGELAARTEWRERCRQERVVPLDTGLKARLDENVRQGGGPRVIGCDAVRNRPHGAADPPVQR